MKINENQWKSMKIDEVSEISPLMWWVCDDFYPFKSMERVSKHSQFDWEMTGMDSP